MKFLFALSVSLVTAAAGIANAQTYPSRPITIVVPFAAGGSVDVMARVLGAKMSESLGQPVIVENRGGGGGMIGMNAVATAKPDGYTILYSPNSIAINPAFYRKPPFDAEKDLTPVSLTLSSILVLVAHPKLKVSSLSELISLAKTKSQKINAGSAGVADPLQLGIEMLKIATGVEIQAIPYKGQGPMYAALLAGEVDIGIVSLQLSLPSIQAGMLRPLGITRAKRVSVMPEVPTIAEAGVPNYDLTSWHGFFAPARTPPDIIGRLHKEVARAVHLPDVRQRIETGGNEPIGSSPAEFEAVLRADVALFKKIVRDAKLPYLD